MDVQPPPAGLPLTPRTTGARLPERYRFGVGDLHAILDEALTCHVSYVAAGQPRIIPTLHARLGDALYLHSSTGSTLALLARSAPVDIAVAVTLIDGLVYARSGFNHSAEYRSAVVHGAATLVTDDAERERLLDAFVDRFSPGRSALLRRPTAAELARTAVLRLALTEASVKHGDHGVDDDPADAAAPVWAGVLPLRLMAAAPVPDNDHAASYPVPVFPSGLT